MALVWDDSFRTLYVDGIAVAEDSQDSLEAPGTGFYIGVGKAVALGTFFSGMIDDVRSAHTVQRSSCSQLHGCDFSKDPDASQSVEASIEKGLHAYSKPTLFVLSYKTYKEGLPAHRSYWVFFILLPQPVVRTRK